MSKEIGKESKTFEITLSEDYEAGRGLKPPNSIMTEEVPWINIEHWYMYKIMYNHLQYELFKNIEIEYGTAQDKDR